MDPTENNYTVSLLLTHSKSCESVQGMAINEDIAYVLYHTGICSVYDLNSKSHEAVDTFPLGSYNDGVPDSRYTNHANSVMFGGYLDKEDEIPLMYVTIGNDGGADKDGYIGRCAVEHITKSINQNGKVEYSAKLLQTIIYNNDGIEHTEWETPCWGWPASFVDAENGWYYIFSARYRTTKAFEAYYDRNAFIITKFVLPMVRDNNRIVVLAPADIIDQFTAPFDAFVTQGGTLHEGKIYHTFGFGTKEVPNGIRVFDLEKKQIVKKIDLSNSVFANQEIESCAFNNGSFLCNTADGNIYQFENSETKYFK